MLLELGGVRALVVGQRRPAQLELGIEAALDREAQPRERRLVPLPAGHPAEREQAQRPVLARASARHEAIDVDRVAGRVQLRRLERERAAVDAEDDVGEARGDAQRAARVPVRVPEQERHAARLRERRQQHQEERHHVDEHGVRAARELAACCPREPQPATGARACAEGRQLDRRRQVVSPDRAAEDVHGVEAVGEGPHEVDRLGERGMVGVDRLRDEEQPHQRTVPATVASASARSCDASSSGVECHSS